MVSRETLVKDSEYAIILIALTSKWNVIIDDTNLNPKYISDLINIAKKTGAKIEFKKFIVPLDELLKRDASRENPVGEDVILKFWEKYNERI